MISTVDASIEKFRQHVTETEFDPDELVSYCREVATVCQQELAIITDAFHDKAQFPDRPQVLLSDPYVHDKPTVWLLGWRFGEGTAIHDHVDSRAGICVFQGQITEHVWNDYEAQCMERTLYAPSLVDVPTPYVHLFRNERPELAISLHVYYPCLISMRYFEETKDGRLVYTGTWLDGVNER